MTFLQRLQNKLTDLYREFPEDINEINILMTPNNFKITTEEQVIDVSTNTIKRIDYSQYLFDLNNAELDFDFGLYVETDIPKLIQYIDNLKNPNGKRLLAYSIIEAQMNLLIAKVTKKKALEYLKEHCQQNVFRFRQIAKRAFKLLKVIDEFPIKLTTKVTLRWLYSLTEGEFEEFIRKCENNSELENHFAGAQF